MIEIFLAFLIPLIIWWPFGFMLRQLGWEPPIITVVWRQKYLWRNKDTKTTGLSKNILFLYFTHSLKHKTVQMERYSAVYTAFGLFFFLATGRHLNPSYGSPFESIVTVKGSWLQLSSSAKEQDINFPEPNKPKRQ